MGMLVFHLPGNPCEGRSISPMKKRRKMRRIRRVILCILLAVFLYSAARLIHYAAEAVSTRNTNTELQAMFEAAEATVIPAAPAITPSPAPTVTPEPQLPESCQYIGDTILPGAEKMLDINPDTVAWLHIPGGIVDLPVVYRDNSYYLDHDFYGRRSKSGTLFLDEKHPFMEDTQYLVIHGHAMYDGSMFGLLTHYREKGYMDEHPAVYLTTLYRQEEYEVIGVLFVPEDIHDEDYVPYIGMRNFQTAEQFKAFAEIIRSSALHWKEGAEMKPDDALLALSTCYEEYRIVVMCRRINPK